MSIPPAGRVKAAENVLVRELDDESVLLNLDSERYYGLDDVGTRFWRALAAGDSIEAAIDALLGDFDTDRDTLSRDVHALIGELIEHGLVAVEET